MSFKREFGHLPLYIFLRPRKSRPMNIFTFKLRVHLIYRVKLNSIIYKYFDYMCWLNTYDLLLNKMILAL